MSGQYSMMRIPECDICFIPFDLEHHRPKCLPCGHTLCKQCVQNPALERNCPTCRKDLTAGLSGGGLPDNILLIQMMTDEDEPPCKVARRQETEAQRLQRGVDAGRRLVQQLRRLVPAAVEALQRQLDSAVDQLRQMETALQELEREAAGDGGPGAVEEHLQLVAHLEDGLSLLTTQCAVVAEEENGTTWRASVPLGPLRLLLLQLQGHGLLEKQVTGCVPAYVGPPGISVLTIDTELDLEEGQLKVNEILKDEHRWRNARRLEGLQGVSSERLLRVLAPNLEELSFAGTAKPSDMSGVLSCASLRRLVVHCERSTLGKDSYPDLPLQLEEITILNPCENQLLCLARMPRLRSLKVYDYMGPDVAFPPSQHRSLLWLSVGFHVKRGATMLSLIRAHAPSLQQLHVYCVVDEERVPEFSFPDLARDLAACGLSALRRLVLERPGSECGQVDACLLQRRALRDALPAAVDVVSCAACGLAPLRSR